MILVDSNILLYAFDSSSPHHQSARKWLEATLAAGEPVGLAWVTILAFLRISTSPRPLYHPLSTAEAMAIVSNWLRMPAITVLTPGERHWETLRNLLLEGQGRGPLVTDAHLAALATEHGAMLCTTDRDFTRFPGLRVLNPLKDHSRKR